MDSLKKIKLTAGLSATLLLGGGAAVRDVTVLDVPPIERVEIIAGERVEAKQIENTVEASFPWKDQPGIKVKYDMGEPTLEEKAKDVRKKQVITETVTDLDGGFKVDIILSEKPNTNRFCYTIEGAENYDFFYQPPLTEEEISEGASRPPEIEGSYAVYHKTLKNHQVGKENYATGKVIHIPRPQVWSLSDENTKEWADLSYNGGGLCVTVPQDFLDKVEYPVRIDPTFGYTSVGATQTSQIAADTNNTAARAGRGYTLPDNATLDSLHIALKVSSADSVDVTALLNEENTATDSHVQLAKVENLNLSLSTTMTFYTFTAASESISAGSHIISATADGADVSLSAVGVYIASDTGASGNQYFDTFINNGYTTLRDESPWVEDDASSTAVRSMYATYTTAPASTTPVLTTDAATSIGTDTATLNADITDDGGATITQHGFAWGTNSGLSGGDTATTSLGAGAEGVFDEIRSSLAAATTYYFRAYAVNSEGTTTASILNFTTDAEEAETPVTPYTTIKGDVQMKGDVYFAP